MIHELDIDYLEMYLDNHSVIDLLKWIKKRFNGIQSFSVGNAKRATFYRENDCINFFINSRFVGSLYSNGYFRPAISNNSTFGCTIGKYLKKKMRDDIINNILV